MNEFGKLALRIPAQLTRPFKCVSFLVAEAMTPSHAHNACAVCNDEGHKQ